MNCDSSSWFYNASEDQFIVEVATVAVDMEPIWVTVESCATWIALSNAQKNERWQVYTLQQRLHVMALLRDCRQCREVGHLCATCEDAHGPESGPE